LCLRVVDAVKVCAIGEIWAFTVPFENCDDAIDLSISCAAAESAARMRRVLVTGSVSIAHTSITLVAGVARGRGGKLQLLADGEPTLFG